jgi:5-methylcytosine-specific restriction endonuclease McrA
MRQTSYPHGRPGDVIDHLVPLKKGGSDSTANRP